MFLLNLSLGQFLGLFGGVSLAVVALYLLDRARRSETVATLKFWVSSGRSVASARRRKIQQPVSLLLQILSLGLLLLAIAQWRVGGAGSAPRDHVMMLDCSAWMAAQAPPKRTAPSHRSLMDDARVLAKAYLRALPPQDRVMLVRVEALATPATGFETNRMKLEAAIAGSVPGSTALNLEQALDFARQSQALSSSRRGEIVFISPGRVAGRQEFGSPGAIPENLRAIPVVDVADNCGLRKLSVRRSAVDSGLWEVYVAARNYGSRTKTIPLSLRFGGALIGARKIILSPGTDQEEVFTCRTVAAGWLEARLHTRDALPADDQAILELPEQRPFTVTVFSDEPELWRAALSANTRVQASFKPAASSDSGAPARLVILDRVQRATPPNTDSIWIDPPRQGSPLPIRRTVTNAPVVRWLSDHPLGTGLRTRDLRLESASVFEAAPADLRIAEVAEGPVVVVRPGNPNIVVVGFHPTRTALRYELATPLLFANLLRWLSPDAFLLAEITGNVVGTVSQALDQNTSAADLRVVSGTGKAVPFAVRNGVLQFFSAKPGTVRVSAGNRESIHSLSLPQLYESTWQVPEGTRRGIPRPAGTSRLAWESWPWLALLGAGVWVLEWILFGRSHRRLGHRVDTAGSMLGLRKAV